MTLVIIKCWHLSCVHWSNWKQQHISLLLFSLAPLFSSPTPSKSLASKLTTIEQAINHPDKSISIAWLGQHETEDEKDDGGDGGGREKL